MVGCQPVCTLRAPRSATHCCTCTQQRWDHGQGLWDGSLDTAAVTQGDNLSRQCSTTSSICLSAPPTPAVSPAFFEQGPARNLGEATLQNISLLSQELWQCWNITISLLTCNYHLHKCRRQTPHEKKKKLSSIFNHCFLLGCDIIMFKLITSEEHLWISTVLKSLK